MEIIEEWGTGIRRILKRAEEYGLPEPEFMEIGDTFRVNLYRKADKSKTAEPDNRIYFGKQRDYKSAGTGTFGAGGVHDKTSAERNGAAGDSA